MKRLFLLCAIAVTAIADIKTISIRLDKPISMGSSKQIEAKFDSLDPNADSAFKRALFIGSASYEKLSNGETRISIAWNQVKDGSKSVSVDPFITRAVTSDPAIPAGTTLKAKGDTELLTAAIRSMGNAAGNGVVTSGGAASPARLNSVSSAYGSPQSLSSSRQGSSGTSSGSSGNLIYSTPSSGATGSSNGGSSSLSASSTCKPLIDIDAGTYTITENNGKGCAAIQNLPATLSNP